MSKHFLTQEKIRGMYRQASVVPPHASVGPHRRCRPQKDLRAVIRSSRRHMLRLERFQLEDRYQSVSNPRRGQTRAVGRAQGTQRGRAKGLTG